MFQNKTILYRIALGFLILFVFYLTIYPQSVRTKFEHINTEKGLSQNAVHSIIQDQKGFIWFATEDGLIQAINVLAYDPLEPNTEAEVAVCVVPLKVAKIKLNIPEIVGVLFNVRLIPETISFNVPAVL